MVHKKLVAASAAPLLLALLARGESYGYALIQEARALSGGELAWNEGMLYPVLHRMEREGLITSRWGASQGRRRRWYHVTDAGSRALSAERAEWEVVNATLSRAWEGGRA